MRHGKRDRWPRVRPLAVGRCGRGQSTVEYALVLVAFLASLLALAAVWRAWADGTLLSTAVDSSSHLLSPGLEGALQDTLLY